MWYGYEFFKVVGRWFIIYKLICWKYRMFFLKIVNIFKWGNYIEKCEFLVFFRKLEDGVVVVGLMLVLFRSGYCYFGWCFF